MCHRDEDTVLALLVGERCCVVDRDTRVCARMTVRSVARSNSSNSCARCLAVSSSGLASCARTKSTRGHSVARHHRSVPVPHLPWTGHEQRASLRLEYFVSAFREGRERVPKRPTPLLRRTLAAIEPASAVAAPALDPMRAAPCHEDGSDRPAPTGQGGPVCTVRSWGPPHAEINGRRQTPVAVARRPNGPTAVHHPAADRALKWRAQLLARSLLFRAAAVSVSKFNC